MLVDSHCHLDYLARDGYDLEEVVGRAHRADVGTLVTICTKLSQFEDQILPIAERFDNVWCSVGVHPHEAESETDVTFDRLVAYAKHPKVVAIGETGLDYFYEHSPREAQKTAFRTHIAAARETGLPLIVHTRDADDDTMDILEEEAGKGTFPGLIHCFSSSDALAKRAVAIGMSISISGILTFKKADSIRDSVRDVDIDRLLVETDAPYLAPVPNRGKTNEPAFVVHTAASLAQLKNVTEDRLADITTENFFTLFTKVKRPA